MCGSWLSRHGVAFHHIHPPVRCAATHQMSAVHGDGFHASDGLNLCKPLTVLLRLDAVATTRARRQCSSSGLTLVSTRAVPRTRVGDARECGFCGVGVGHRKVASENVQCRSLSSIHILYNHAPVRATAVRTAPWSRLTITLCTEVVPQRLLAYPSDGAAKRPYL